MGKWTPMDSSTCPMVQWDPMGSPTSPMVQWDRIDSRIWGSSGGIVDSHGQSHLSMVQCDRTDSGIWGSSGGTVDSHGQFHLSHGSGIGQWGMVVLRWDSGLPWTVPPVPW